MEITHISAKHPGFPAGLSSAYRPPRELYVRGPIPEGPAVAVIGTRRMTDYGKAVTRMLVPELVRAGVTVVSGLALGVDGEAHAATLDAGGRTVAVIGSGVDDASIYPRAHAHLARKILDSGGAIISEYPPGTPSLRHHFPERNRIVVGLTQAVLVIEAPERSGARITARLALEAGRDVWAVPGPVTHPNSWTPHDLIRNGATPVCGPDDIRAGLGLPAAAAEAKQDHPILKLLAAGPLSADQISRAAGIPPDRLLPILTGLEIDGRIAAFGGGRYILYT